MTIRKLKRILKKRSRGIFNGTLIALLPTFEFLSASLPQIREFLPENIYNVMGLVAIGGNLILNHYVENYVKNKEDDLDT